MTDITANVIVSMPSQLFTMARSFKAVANGKIYIGKIDTDPVNPENRIQVYIENEDGSHVPVSQPIIINAAGYPVYNGQIAKFVTVQGHSMAVYDAYGVQQFYFPNVLKYDPDQLKYRLASHDGAKYIGYSNDYFNGTMYDYLRKSEGMISSEFFGVVADGVTDDSAAIMNAANALGYVLLPEGKTTFIGSNVTLPVGMGFFGALGQATLRIADGARIYSTSPTSSSSQVVSLVYNRPYITSTVDISGKYIEISNGLPDLIFGAETAPENSIDPIAISRDDANFGTYKAAMFKCTRYDAATQRAYLDVNPDFSASGVTASIYDDVNHIRYENITFMDENTATTDNDGVLRFRRNYGGGIVNCNGIINYVDFSNFCNFNVFSGNNVTVGATVLFSWNCCDNTISGNNVIGPNLRKDALIGIFKNCRRNKINSNIVSGISTSGNHWAIMLHTNCDYNDVLGNITNSLSGIGDYAFNKGNLIANNHIRCDAILLLGLVNTKYIDNVIVSSNPMTILVSETVDVRGNEFIYVGAQGGGCVSLYDVAQKPFGFKGFKVSPTRRIYLDGSTFYYSESRAAINYRDIVDFTKTPSSYIPSTVTGILGNGVAAIYGYVKDTRSISIKNCKFKSIHVGLLVVCENAGTNFRVDSGEEDFTDVDAAYIVKSTDLNNNTRGLESYNATFTSVNIAFLTSNYPVYASGARFRGVTSALVQASAVGLVYTGIIDRNCVASGTGSLPGVNVWYDFLTGKPSAPNYNGQLTSSAAHPFSFRIPNGAEYYQLSADMNVIHNFLFINRSTPSTPKTIVRSITEVAYT